MATDTAAGDAADQIMEDEIRRSTAAGKRSGGSSTEYDSPSLDAPPSTDRRLQPAALEVSYGGSDSVMNTGQARARSDTQWSKSASKSKRTAVDGGAEDRTGVRPDMGRGKARGKGKGIKRSERQGSILAGFSDIDAEA